MQPPSITRMKASDDFNKARNKAWMHEVQHFMHPDKKRLLSFNDVKKILKPKNEIYSGFKTVPIQKIVGSEGRYNDFDNEFLPKTPKLRQRWERIDQAHLTDVILPPILLYEIAGLFFVRDGNHRVSVAKAQGVEFIDAEVISLQTEIFLKPNVRPDTILAEVINYEKRIFYAETNFGDLTDFWDLNFSATGQYDVIYNHILVHKYYLSEEKGEEVDFNTSILSWFNTVYLPVLAVIHKYKLVTTKSRTESDMYVWVVKHWDSLKQKYGMDYSLEDATKNYAENQKHEKRSIFSLIKKLWKS